MQGAPLTLARPSLDTLFCCGEAYTGRTVVSRKNPLELSRGFLFGLSGGFGGEMEIVYNLFGNGD